MTKQNGITGFLRQNAWAIIVFTGITIAGYATLNAKVNAMEKKIAEYPSQDYFELRFSTIEKNQNEIKSLLMEHLNK